MSTRPSSRNLSPPLLIVKEKKRLEFLSVFLHTQTPIHITQEAIPSLYTPSFQMQPASKARRLWTSVALCALSLCCIHTEAQQAFTSIDCGGATAYTDENGLSWIPDSILVGNKTTVTPPAYANATTPLSTVRYFPGNQSKYCYVFNSTDNGVVQGNSYLVRASFWAGSTLPYNTQVANRVTFKLLIYADVWDTVTIVLPQTGREETREIYVVAVRDTIDVCLAGQVTGSDIPFISSLALRPLFVNMTSVRLMADRARNRPLMYRQRINYGADSADTYIRYQGDGLGDPYDRIWEPNTQQPILTTTSVVGTDVIDHPPVRIMQTAYERDDSFILNFMLPTGTYYHFSVFFSEISPNVSLAGQRVFDLQVFNGSYLFGSTMLDLFKLANNSRNNVYLTYSVSPLYVGTEGFINFTFIKQNGSIFGPLVCGLELLQVFDNDLSLGTDDDEVATLKIITNAYPSLDIWSGDPCLPYAYNWLTCTNDSRPYISTISLDNQALSGEIPTGFKNFKDLKQLSLAENKFTGSIPDLTPLQYLEVLDLHGNNLSGPIPDSLAELPALTILNLDNNNFSGEIPAKLLTKASESGLNLSIAGNPGLCITGSNQKFCSVNTIPEKKNSNGALVGGLAAAGAIVAVLIIGVLVFCCVKRVKPKKHTVIDSKNSSQQAKTMEIHSSVLPEASIIGRANQAQIFSYASIKSMTRNFERVIGQGGFGPVYHGELQNGKLVAVKVLSKDSRQGENEFLNEVELLSRVHHKNLVSLVGYCIEAELVLVYEYMANGSLFDSLKGKGVNLTVWKDRLQIAADASEGLDYLHRGCSPSIIHRDVKSSNILLDEEHNGRISDFGISKSKQYDPSMLTGDSQIYTVVQGSIGYLDPAYAETNIAAHSIDVYAFGIVLFELVTGRSPMIQQMTRNGEPIHILQWARPHINRGDISSIIDPRLSNDMNVSSMWKVVDVAMMCVEHDRKKRPSMNEIKQELQVALSMETQNNHYDTTSTDHMTGYIDTASVHAR